MTILQEYQIVISQSVVCKYVNYYKLAGNAIVVAKDTTLLFYHGNAVILTLW